MSLTAAPALLLSTPPLLLLLTAEAALFRVKNLFTNDDLPEKGFPITAILHRWTGRGGGCDGGGGGFDRERVEPGRTRTLLALLLLLLLPSIILTIQ